MTGMYTEIVCASYAIAALSFLLFGLFLLTTSNGQMQRLMLGIASCVSAAWAMAEVVQVFVPGSWSLSGALLEVLRNIAWSVFLLLLGMLRQKTSVAGCINRWTVALALAYLANLVCTFTVSWQYGYPVLMSQFMIITMFRTASSILGLFLVEQLYRNTVAEQRWGIKFACLGMGLLFAYDFYLYSDGLLFRQINPDIWGTRGFVNALAVPLIALSTWRNPRWSLSIKVSRHILFHSAALSGAAIYLLAMASAGYYLRIFGGTWGAVMQLAFLCGALILLLGMLFSGAVRSRLRVFISKHFYNYNYDYREEWLSLTRALSVKGPDLEQRIVMALAKLVESPGGAAFVFRDEHTCEAVSRWNMAISSEHDDHNANLFSFLEETQWVIDLLQYANNPGHYKNIALPRWLCEFPRAWLVVPLDVQGKLLGFVVLTRSRSPLKLNWEVTDLLKIAASQAASYLAQQQFATDLMVARQFESFNRMSTFVVHDLKNLVSQLSLLMTNAERHKDNPEFQRDMIETVDFSVQKMRLLLHKLSRKDSKESNQSIEIAALLERTVRSKSAVEPRPLLTVRTGDLLVMADLERLERVLGHIIQNAIEACSSHTGKVLVELDREEDHALITVSDNGHGMSEEFIRQRLFKPFETTKSAGMGIGVFETRDYIHALGGEVQVDSTEAVGTRFRIKLPLHPKMSASAVHLQEVTSDSN